MSPHPDRTTRVTGLTRRDDTLLRLGGRGTGDNFHMTWASDGRQYVAVDDGHGWADPPGIVCNSSMWTIEGPPGSAVFEPVAGYPELDLATALPSRSRPLYYGFGTLAVGEAIYQFLSTEELKEDPLEVEFGDFAFGEVTFIGAKLIYSPDLGRTWRNHDGSPHSWESWEQRPDGMVFYREPQNAFSVLSILQMGRSYEWNRDGYVYVYSANGSVEGSINELVMFRTPIDRILDRGSYEYFAGLDDRDEPRWTSDIARRAVVCRFPAGYGTPHAHTWVPSIVYDEPLGIYLMSNWAMAWMLPDERPAARPSYLGFWISETPWGPWTQIHEETEWLPGGDAEARAYEAQIAPMWLAEDGMSFWLVWSECRMREPYYAFSTQRFDIGLREDGVPVARAQRSPIR